MGMNIYTHLLLLSLVTIYIVDISGFTDAWKSALARWLKVSALKPIRPFDCGKCMAWWVCLIYAICTGHLSLGTIAFSALMSHLSITIGSALILIREWIAWIIDKLMPW